MMIFSGRVGQFAVCASAGETSAAAPAHSNALRVCDILILPLPAFWSVVQPLAGDWIVAHRARSVQRNGAHPPALASRSAKVL
jgi:hypothetical protein